MAESQPRQTKRHCAVCEKDSNQVVWKVEADGAAPDFDTRPGGNERPTIEAWVERCPHCGYCAEQIEFAAEAAAEIIQTAAYKEALNDFGLPEPVRPFHAFSTLLEQMGAFAVAGHIALWCAWRCDDLAEIEAAVRCRIRAVKLWKEGKRHKQSFGDDIWEEFGLGIDVLRRAGKFEEARGACEAALEMEDLPLSFEVLYRRQKSLIERRDNERHSMDELPPPPSGAQRVILQ